MLSLSVTYITCSFSRSVLGIAILFSTFLLPTLAAPFDAKKFFSYIDQSCNSHIDAINVAGDDMIALAKAGQESFNWTPLRVKTFAAYFGQLTDDISLEDNSKFPEFQFNKFSKNLISGKFSLYCDGSAIKWVTTQQEGAEKGKPHKKVAGRWYVAADRRAPNTNAFYIDGTQREDYCKNQKGDKQILGASAPGQPYVILCPDAFTLRYQTLLGVKDTQQPLRTGLDSMTSTGAVMFHEFTHALLNTNSNHPEVYGTQECLLIASNAFKKDSVLEIRQNADTFMLYAMASYLQQNSWVFGVAGDKTAFDPKPAQRRARRRRLIDIPLYPRGNLTGGTPGATGTDSGTGAVQFGTAASTYATSSTEIIATNTNTPEPSATDWLTSSTSLTSGTSELSFTVPGTVISSNVFSDPLPTLTGSLQTSSKASTISPGMPGSTKLGGTSSVSSASLTTKIPSSSSSLEIPAVPFRGTWKSSPTPSPLTFLWPNIPTTTVSGAAATSEAALIGGLFFALKANRHWLTDPKLKSQYLNDVKRTRDETLALFNALDVKVPEPDCSNTKRKRNMLSEKQLRVLLHDRDIISSAIKVIGGAIGNAAKLVSCALNVVKNLVDSVEVDVPDVNLIEDLTDTLAEIAKHLEDKEDTKPSSTERSSSQSTSSSSLSSSSSSSSSSCTDSTAIPICTQTVSFSTSSLGGDQSSFIVATITQTTCVTTTIAGCAGAGTSTTTVSSSIDSAIDEGSEAILIATTYAPLPEESLAWLSSVIANEYTESIDYRGTTAAAATATASSEVAPTSSGMMTSSSSATIPNSLSSSQSSSVSIPNTSGMITMTSSSATSINPSSSRSSSISMTTAPGMSTYTSSSATPTITPPPKCNEGTNELMGFNNEPSSWCFCLASNGGNLGPFSTMKDLTTNFCAFPALPTQTISLTSHPTTINTACVVTSGTYTLGPTPTVNTFCQCGDEMVGIQTTINPAGTKYIGCGTTTTFSTITPTINPTPTAPVQCFPIHGGPGGPITDADKLLKITSPNVAALCNGTDANWRLSGPGGSSPAGNNFIKSGYTLRDDAPDDCKHFYRGNLTPLQVDLCAIPQEALIDNCPYNGGKIQTVCGEWWVTSCVLSSGICVGP